MALLVFFSNLFNHRVATNYLGFTILLNLSMSMGYKISNRFLLINRPDLKGNSGFSCLAWQPTGNYLAAGNQNGELAIWQLAPSGKGFGNS